MDNAAILEMRDITKSFPGVKALDNASLCLMKAEVHALIGENGAGKSTLMKVLLGIVQPDKGEILFKGRRVEMKNPKMALQNAIAMIHQEISLVPSMDVVENIWLGQERKFVRRGVIDRKARARATQELFDRVGISIDIGSRVSDLSIAQMQLVEIMRAISWQAEIIVMDEPTSALTSSEIDLLHTIVRDLARNGVTIVFISHKLDEIFRFCDRVTIMRDGKFIATRDCGELSRDELITMIVGRELSAVYPAMGRRGDEVALEVSGLSLDGVFSDVEFSVRKGEILGFYGLMGAGRTEIMSAIFGLTPPSGGRISVFGENVHIRHPKDAIRLGIAMITEDRLRQGAIHELSVKENMSLSYLERVRNGLRLVNGAREAKDCDSMSDALAIKLSSIEEKIRNLSGGNQQKVILGRWMLTEPKILIMDEPTRGIDVGAKSEIYRLIGDLASEGMAIILVSAELPEILGLCHRIMIVRDGRIVFETENQGVSQELLVSKAFGV